MKLELKHLAPYLPYKLKFITNKHGIKYGVQTILTARGLSLQDDLSLNIEFLYDDELYFSNEMKTCTPILFPLHHFLDKDNNYKEIQNYIGLNKWCDTYDYFLKALVFAPTCIEELVLQAPYPIFCYFIKNRYDVFGLIDAGLAKPVTDDFNPYK